MKNLINIVILMISATAVVAESPVAPDGSEQQEDKRGFREIHNSIESDSLRISLGSDLKGFIEGKVCDQCETIKVTITPETKAYKDNVEVPLLNAKSRLGRDATVMYELETKNVSAIRW
jgi:hypothetical protein